MEQPVLRIEKLSKDFPGVRALDRVDFAVKEGQTHALLGENGAGKSTLIKIIGGVFQPTEGEVLLRGQPCRFQGPGDAFRRGISIIHQETSLIPKLSALQNVFLGNEIKRGGGFLLHEEAMRIRFTELCGKVGLTLDPQRQTSEFSIAEQKIIEILKALNYESSLLIMDEPTDSLSAREIERLFTIIEDLKRHGVTVIYITHFLGEVFQIADRLTVLRDGKHVKTGPVAELDEERVVSLMVGKEMSAGGTGGNRQVPRERRPDSKPILQVSGVTRKKKLRGISFEAYPGEVLGITGVVGAGKTEMARALFGADKIDGGSITINGCKGAPRSPRQAVRRGLGMMPEDRKAHGVILKDSIRRNITICSLEKVSRRGILSRSRETQACAALRRELNVKARDLSLAVNSLSGGNQQKIVIAKWLLADPDVILMDEPTRGIDVGAKQEIFKIVRKLASQGKCVLYISAEIPEVLACSDRVLVMRKERIVDEVAPETSRERIMQLMLQGE